MASLRHKSGVVQADLHWKLSMQTIGIHGVYLRDVVGSINFVSLGNEASRVVSGEGEAPLVTVDFALQDLRLRAPVGLAPRPR